MIRHIAAETTTRVLTFCHLPHSAQAQRLIHVLFVAVVFLVALERKTILLVLGAQAIDDAVAPLAQRYAPASDFAPHAGTIFPRITTTS